MSGTVSGGQRMRKKISVIIATYNTGEYIEECLDSVLAQSMCNDIEIVIVDDGSTDNTKEILDDYQRKHNSIIVIRQKNSGQGIARNLGMSIASGSYMVFMDPDDLYPANDCLEKMYNATQMNCVKICGGNIIRFNTYEEIKGYTAGEGDYRKTKNGIIRNTDYFNLYGHTRYMINSDLIRQNKVVFGPYRNYEDQMFTMKALGAAGEFYELDYPVYKHRINHKRRIFNELLYIDTLNGFIDAMDIIGAYDLRLMCEHNYQEFINIYLPKIEKYIEKNPVVWNRIIHRMNNSLSMKGWIDNENLITNDRIEQERKKRECSIRLIEKIIASHRPLIIYGAGNNTRKFLDKYNHELGAVYGIAVSDTKNNPKSISGIRVKRMDYYKKYRKEAHVIVTVSGILGKELAKEIYDDGFCFCDWLYLNWMD